MDVDLILKNMFKNKKGFFSVVFLITSLFVGGIFLYKDIAKGAEFMYTDESHQATPDLAGKNIFGPTVDVLFLKEKSILSEGDEIRAEAITSRFDDSNSNLYFTWYLKRDEGTDQDGDGDYDENDWKIEAAKIIARGDYDGKQSSGGSNDGNNDGHRAWPRWDGSNSKDSPNCYVQDFSRGGVYELKQTEAQYSCSNPVCVSSKSFNCDYPGTLPTDSGLDETEGKNICQKETVDIECVVDNPDTFTSSTYCETGTPVCQDSNLFSAGLTSSQLCLQIPYHGNTNTSCSTFSLTAPTCTFKEKSGNSNICRHLFAQMDEDENYSGDGNFGDAEEDFWGTDKNNTSTAGNGQVDEANVVGLGIDKFKWKYRNGDEVGLIVEGKTVYNTKHYDGTKMIMWAFSKNRCDAISKAIGDNNNKTRRFYVQDTFGLKEGIMTIGDANKDKTVDSKDLDLNDCLEENLIDPAEGSSSGYLDINLSYAPSSPKNDPYTQGDFNKGDVVRVVADVPNAENAQNLIYTWQVQRSNTGTNSDSESDWTDITGRLTEHSALSGLGNSTFQLKLNLPESVFLTKGNEQFIRFKVTVRENTVAKRESSKTIAVKISQVGPEIIPYAVSVVGGKLTTSGQICNTADGAECMVSINQIIGLKLPSSVQANSIIWKLNGAVASCGTEVSNECDGNKAFFFPITGSVGDLIELKAEAVLGDGTVQTFTKNFKIIEPYLQVRSKDVNHVWPKELGYFKNLDGSVSADLSDSLFQTVQGSTATLIADFVPDYMNGDGKSVIKKWIIDGVEIVPNPGREIVFEIQKKAGSFYNISLEAEYVEPSEIRTALAKFWGIPAIDSGEKIFESTMQIEIIPAEYAKIDDLKSGKGFLANIFSNVPEQVLFIVRLALTIVLLVVFSGLIFSLIPDIKKTD